MAISVPSLLDRLRELAAANAPPRRFIVAYSGGRDSTVLLHALAAGRGDVPLVAAHINHRLQPEADAWQAHCASQAAALGVPFECRQLAIADDARGGIEAAARSARYAALTDLMQAGDWLLCAHHEDDQAETLLLNLMRGSGTDGLAGIGEFRAFGPGYLVRPLLEVGGRELEDYAQARNLPWVVDASNDLHHFDRNFLRHQILPLLTARWPAAASRVARSARLAGAASAMLEELAMIDIASAGAPERLAIDALLDLSVERQRNLLRHAARYLGLPPLPAAQLERMLSEVLPARADAEPLVRWPGAEARRYRGCLYLLVSPPIEPVTTDAVLTGTSPVQLPGGLGELSLAAHAGGIEPRLAERGLAVRFRRGGESIRPAGHDCTHKLKKLLQQHAIVPWMRPRIPLLYAGDRLVAVADLWIDAEHHDAKGYTVHWNGAPALY